MTSRQRNNRARGFTLVEMVTVIVILGILAVGTTSFIRFGSQMYVETSEREQLISTGRFAVERLNREIRATLPNSIRIVDGDGNSYEAGIDLEQCLEFTPVITSTLYIDIPIAPETATNTISVNPFNIDSFAADMSDFLALDAAVYTLSTDNVYIDGDRVYAMSSIDMLTNAAVWTITLDAAIQYASDSPTQRLYFVDTSVQYCLAGSRLTRKKGTDSVLMAEDLVFADSSFTLSDASLFRNAITQVRLTFNKNSETVDFNNEVQVPNVP